MCADYVCLVHNFKIYLIFHEVPQWLTEDIKVTLLSPPALPMNTQP